MLRQVTLILPSLTLMASFVIESNRITNWGKWSKWDQCPDGSFVKAIDIKLHPYNSSADNTAVNGVRLSCVDLKEEVKSIQFSAAKVLKSIEGPWGTFTGLKYCHGGMAVGFQLKSEKGRGGKVDDNAATDMVLICSNTTSTYKTETTGHIKGSWRTEKTCLRNMAVCGFRAQVEPDQKKADDTALNNVDLLCCDLVNEAKICQPTDNWIRVLRWDNSRSRGTIKYKLTFQTGVQKDGSLDSKKAKTELQTLRLNFEKFANRNQTNPAWSQAVRSSFSAEKGEAVEVQIRGMCDTIYYQLVGKCGPYIVNSSSLKRIDKYANGTEIVSYP